MQAYLERMEQPETQQFYKQRKAVAETPHLWWKAIFAWRQFSVRGLARAAKEAILAGTDLQHSAMDSTQLETRNSNRIERNGSTGTRRGLLLQPDPACGSL
jgi:hypothetical protein